MGNLPPATCPPPCVPALHKATLFLKLTGRDRVTRLDAARVLVLVGELAQEMPCAQALVWAHGSLYVLFNQRQEDFLPRAPEHWQLEAAGALTLRMQQLFNWGNALDTLTELPGACQLGDAERIKQLLPRARLLLDENLATPAELLAAYRELYAPRDQREASESLGASESRIRLCQHELLMAHDWRSGAPAPCACCAQLTERSCACGLALCWGHEPQRCPACAEAAAASCTCTNPNCLACGTVSDVRGGWGFCACACYMARCRACGTVSYSWWTEAKSPEPFYVKT